MADREMGVEMEELGWGPEPIDAKAAPEVEELTDDERGPIVGCDDGCDVQQIHRWETRWVENRQKRDDRGGRVHNTQCESLECQRRFFFLFF